MKKQKTGRYFFKKSVKIPIYGGSFIMIFSNDVEKVGAVVGHDNIDYGQLYASTYCNAVNTNTDNYCVVLNFWNPNGDISIGTITHEVTHAANRLLYSRGMERDWMNDEPEAYLKGWMADQIHSFMVACDILR